MRLAATPEIGNPGHVSRESEASAADILGGLGDVPDGNVVGETPGSLYANQFDRWQALPEDDEDSSAPPLMRYRDAMVGPARDMGMPMTYSLYPHHRMHDGLQTGMHVVIGPYPWLVAIEGDQDQHSPEDYQWVRRVPPDAWDAPQGDI